MLRFGEEQPALDDHADGCEHDGDQGRQCRDAGRAERNGGQRQQQRCDEGAEQCHAPQAQRVFASDLIAHFTHHEIGLGVRLLEHAHRAKASETRCRFGGMSARRGVDLVPVALLQHQAAGEQHRNDHGRRV